MPNFYQIREKARVPAGGRAPATAAGSIPGLATISKPVGLRIQYFKILIQLTVIPNIC